jgi:CO/xanthine dehydrogenase FAD-binding subunit
MKTPAAAFEMRAPRTLDEALTIVAAEPGVWRPFAGGTDLMVLMEAGKLPPGRYLSLQHLSELRRIDAGEQAVTIGALTTYTDIIRHPLLASDFPLLGEAARETGGVATQNRGTLGGNIANASPAADTPPALLVYDAEIELASVRGTRRLPYDAFHTGYKTMQLAADELIAAVVLPRRATKWIEAYRKVGTRRAQAISKVCFAAGADVRDRRVRDIRIAYGSVAPTVVRARHAEDALRGQVLADAVIADATRLVLEDISPIDDIRSTAAYRRTVAQNLLREFLGSAAVKGRGDE